MEEIYKTIIGYSRYEISNYGNIRNKKGISYTIEYRKPNEKRTSFTSNNIQDCLIHYCKEMDIIDSSVSKLIRDFYNL